MPTKTTPLTSVQMIRLLSLYDFEEEPLSASLVEVEETPLKKISVVLPSKETSIHPSEEHMDFILNGIRLSRNA